MSRKLDSGVSARTLGVGLFAVYAMGCSSGSDIEDSAVATTSQALLGEASSGLTPAQQTLFANGKSAFIEVETVPDGLGPVFNEKACANCHSVGAIGGSGVQFEVRAGRSTGGTFDSLPSQGGQLFDLFSVT